MYRQFYIYNTNQRKLREAKGLSQTAVISHQGDLKFGTGLCSQAGIYFGALLYYKLYFQVFTRDVAKPSFNAICRKECFECVVFTYIIYSR